MVGFRGRFVARGHAAAVGARVVEENVAVAKAARRLGFGATLVNVFLRSHFCSKNEMQISEVSVKSVFLEVRESNLAARKLYEKLRFKSVGRRTSYYREPQEDAIVYRYSFQ